MKETPNTNESKVFCYSAFISWTLTACIQNVVHPTQGISNKTEKDSLKRKKKGQKQRQRN